jgi:PAS domain S-box-containing protein
VSAQLGELDGEPIAISSIADITERKRAEEALRENEERFSAIYDHAPYAIGLMQQPEGTLAAVNEAWERMFGYGRLEALGKTTVELGLAPDLEGRAGLYAEIRARGSVRDFELAYATRSGERRLGAFSFDPIEIGGQPFLLGTVIDVTERRRAEDALREANRRKDEFLGMLSHELRNPLAPIRNSVYVLEHADPGSEQAARARSVLQRQSEHLTRLVDDLLDVTRIARGKIELRRSRTDLREVVWRAAEDYRLIMDDRGVALRTALPEEKAWADVDPTRVNQVVGNLLHNAAKYTRRGDEVALSLRIVGDAAEIRVRDTGAGIEASLLPRVFEPFVQGQRTLSRTEGGLGLGLALVKGIVELHGGKVHAESAGVGQGAEFVVQFPLRAGGAASMLQPGDAAPAPNGGRRVLVVDDNLDAAESLADLLRLLGHEADVAHDGPSALAKLGGQVPDVVFCDIGLPGMDGYEVARAMRAGGGRDLQLVALSGYAQPEDVKRAIEAGFDTHVAKPPDPAAIERLLG